MGVDKVEGGGQLAAELGNMGGEEDWRLSLMRLVERPGTGYLRIPATQAVCVVSKARAKRAIDFGT